MDPLQLLARFSVSLRKADDLRLETVDLVELDGNVFFGTLEGSCNHLVLDLECLQVVVELRVERVKLLGHLGEDVLDLAADLLPLVDYVLELLDGLLHRLLVAVEVIDSLLLECLQIQKRLKHALDLGSHLRLESMQVELVPALDVDLVLVCLVVVVKGGKPPHLRV